MAKSGEEAAPLEPYQVEWFEQEMAKIKGCSLFSESEKKKLEKIKKAEHFKACQQRAGIEPEVKKLKPVKKVSKKDDGAAEEEEEEEDGERGSRPNYWALCTKVCASGDDYGRAKQLLRLPARGTDGARHYGLQPMEGSRPGGQAPNGGKGGCFWVFERNGEVQRDASIPIVVYLKKDTPGTDNEVPFTLCIPEGQAWFTFPMLRPTKLKDDEDYKEVAGCFKFIGPPESLEAEAAAAGAPPPPPASCLLPPASHLPPPAASTPSTFVPAAWLALWQCRDLF